MLPGQASPNRPVPWECDKTEGLAAKLGMRTHLMLTRCNRKSRLLYKLPPRALSSERESVRIHCTATVRSPTFCCSVDALAMGISPDDEHSTIIYVPCPECQHVQGEPASSPDQSRGPRDHINIRIAHSGSKVSYEGHTGMPQRMLGRILMCALYNTVLYHTIL